MTGPDIITKLRDAGLLDRFLADLLGLDEAPPAGKAIRCVYPDRHKNGDANPLRAWEKVPTENIEPFHPR